MSLPEEHTSVPSPDPTARTVDALRRDIGALAELVDVKLSEMELAITSMEKMYDRLLDERDRRYGERFEAAENAVSAAFQSSETAIAKAETSIQSKAEATYVKLDRLQDLLVQMPSKSETDQRFADIRDRVEVLAIRLTTMEAAKIGATEQRTGLHESTRMAIALGSFAILIISFILARGGI